MRCSCFQVYHYNKYKFVNPNFPENHIHFALSSTAQHWLSDIPSKINNHIHVVGANDNVKKLYADKAEQDWTNMLLQRAKEFAPGARAIFANFTIDNQGHYLGNNGQDYCIFEKFNDLWYNMAKEGIITVEEYENTNFPQYYRKSEEFTKCLLDKESEVYKLGLRFMSTKKPSQQSVLIEHNLTKTIIRKNLQKNLLEHYQVGVQEFLSMDLVPLAVKMKKKE